MLQYAAHCACCVITMIRQTHQKEVNHWVADPPTFCKPSLFDGCYLGCWLNIKCRLTSIGIPSIKIKTVSWLSSLYDRNPSTGKIPLYWIDPIICMLHDVDNLKQDCSISIANALEILQSCTSRGFYPFDTVVINNSESSWWLQMPWCLVGTRASATIMMT